MSIHRWTDKEVVVHIHNGILLSHKKERIWVSCSEVGVDYTDVVGVARNPEPVIQSEVSQKEKDKYHIVMHICGI